MWCVNSLRMLLHISGQRVEDDDSCFHCLLLCADGWDGEAVTLAKTFGPNAGVYICEVRNGKTLSSLFHAQLHVQGSNEIHSRPGFTRVHHKVNATVSTLLIRKECIFVFFCIRHVRGGQWRQTVEDGLFVCMGVVQLQLLSSLARQCACSQNDLQRRYCRSANIENSKCSKLDSISRGYNVQHRTTANSWPICWFRKSYSASIYVQHLDNPTCQLSVAPTPRVVAVSLQNNSNISLVVMRGGWSSRNQNLNDPRSFPPNVCL